MSLPLRAPIPYWIWTITSCRCEIDVQIFSGHRQVSLGILGQFHSLTFHLFDLIGLFQAKKVFLSMFPDEEFLPRVPDPEDVITEDAENPPSQPFPDEAPEDQGPAAEATENQSTDEAGITHETETTPSPAQ